jgi:para-nitrobenzyl esterase
VDGGYLPVTERELIETGQFNDVPFIILVNTNDTLDPIGTWTNVFPWLSDHSRANHYATLFTKVPSGWEDKGLLAYHACELSYVHGYPESLIAHYQLGLVIDPATGLSLPIGDLNGNGISGSAGDTEDIWISAGWDEADAAVTETAMTLWSNFARTGDPSIPGVLEWTPYTSENDLYLELGINPEMKVGQSQLVFPVY